MGTIELETMIQRAVEAGSVSLHDRLDDLEQRLDEVGEKLRIIFIKMRKSPRGNDLPQPSARPAGDGALVEPEQAS